MNLPRSSISPLFSLTFPLCYSLPFHISFPLIPWFNTDIYLARVSLYKFDRCAAFCGVFFLFFCILQCMSVFLHKKNLQWGCWESGCPFKKPCTKLFFRSFFFFWLSRALSKVKKKKKSWPFSEKRIWHRLQFLSARQSRQKRGGWKKEAFFWQNTKMIARHFLSTSTCWTNRSYMI